MVEAEWHLCWTNDLRSVFCFEAAPARNKKQSCYFALLWCGALGAALSTWAINAGTMERDEVHTHSTPMCDQSPWKGRRFFITKASTTAYTRRDRPFRGKKTFFIPGEVSSVQWVSPRGLHTQIRGRKHKSCGHPWTVSLLKICRTSARTGLGGYQAGGKLV